MRRTKKSSKQVKATLDGGFPFEAKAEKEPEEGDEDEDEEEKEDMQCEPGEKKMDAKRVLRIDRSELLRSPEVTQEGYLRLDGKIARTGIQVYRRADGSEVREYRPPQEVFDAKYLGSLAGIPLTNQHPSTLLTSETATEYAVGAVSNARRLDANWVGAVMTVWDESAKRAIKAGRAQLSVGYSAEVYEEPGEVNGERYDCIQRNIVANHLALCDSARAGSEARVRLDDTGNAVPFWKEMKPVAGLTTQEQKAMPHKFKLDSFEIEVADQNVQAIIEGAIAKARKDGKDEAAGEVTVLKAQVQAGEAKSKQDQEAYATLKASIQDEAKKLAEIMDVSRKHLGENFKLDGGPEDWKRDVVKKAWPKLDVSGLVGDALEQLWKMAPAMLEAQPQAGSQGVAHSDASATPEAARRRMEERNRAAFVK